MQELLKKINAVTAAGGRAVIAIDGRSAAGKTTLAAALAAQLGAAVVHMDDFYLPRAMQPEDLTAHPGGNMDFARFRAEGVPPLQTGNAGSYRVFDCKAQAFGEAVPLPAGATVIVEGAYCLHPALPDVYDLRLFVTVAPETQLARVRDRGGEAALAAFRARWIPAEEAYFKAYDVQARCDRVLTYPFADSDSR